VTKDGILCRNTQNNTTTLLVSNGKPDEHPHVFSLPSVHASQYQYACVHRDYVCFVNVGTGFFKSISAEDTAVTIRLTIWNRYSLRVMHDWTFSVFGFYDAIRVSANETAVAAIRMCIPVFDAQGTNLQACFLYFTNTNMLAVLRTTTESPHYFPLLFRDCMSIMQTPLGKENTSRIIFTTLDEAELLIVWTAIDIDKLQKIATRKYEAIPDRFKHVSDGLLEIYTCPAMYYGNPPDIQEAFDHATLIPIGRAGYTLKALEFSADVTVMMMEAEGAQRVLYLWPCVQEQTRSYMTEWHWGLISTKSLDASLRLDGSVVLKRIIAIGNGEVLWGAEVLQDGEKISCGMLVPCDEEQLHKAFLMLLIEDKSVYALLQPKHEQRKDVVAQYSHTTKISFSTMAREAMVTLHTLKMGQARAKSNEEHIRNALRTATNRLKQNAIQHTALKEATEQGERVQAALEGLKHTQAKLQADLLLTEERAERAELKAVTLQRMVDVYKQQKQDLQQQKQTIDVQAERLASALQAAEEADDKQDTMKQRALQKQIHTLKKRIEQLQREGEVFKNQCGEYEASQQHEQHEKQQQIVLLGRQQQRLDELHARVKVQAEDNTRLNTRVKQLEKEQKEHFAAQSKLQPLEDDLAKQPAIIKELQTVRHELTEERQALKLDREALQQHITMLQQLKADLEAAPSPKEVAKLQEALADERQQRQIQQVQQATAAEELLKMERQQRQGQHVQQAAVAEEALKMERQHREMERLKLTEINGVLQKKVEQLELQVQGLQRTRMLPAANLSVQSTLRHLETWVTQTNQQQTTVIQQLQGNVQSLQYQLQVAQQELAQVKNEAAVQWQQKMSNVATLQAKLSFVVVTLWTQADTASRDIVNERVLKLKDPQLQPQEFAHALQAIFEGKTCIAS
jgi:hypothetical protein